MKTFQRNLMHSYFWILFHKFPFWFAVWSLVEKKNWKQKNFLISISAPLRLFEMWPALLYDQICMLTFLDDLKTL